MLGVNMGKINIYPRFSAFTELAGLDFLASEHAFMEVTEWENEEGFDVTVDYHGSRMFSLTWGEYKALKKLVKALICADRGEIGVQNKG